MSDLKLKDESLEDYYRVMEDFFRHRGWAALMEKLDEIEAPRADVRKVSAPDQLRYRQGELAQIDWLRAYPYFVATARVQNIIEDNPELTQEQENNLWSEIEEIKAKVIS